MSVFSMIIVMGISFLSTLYGIDHQTLKEWSMQTTSHFLSPQNNTPKIIGTALLFPKQGMQPFPHNRPCEHSLPFLEERYLEYYLEKNNKVFFKIQASSTEKDQFNYVTLLNNHTLIGFFFSPYEARAIICAREIPLFPQCVIYHLYDYWYDNRGYRYLGPHISAFPNAFNSYPSGAFVQDNEKTNFVFFLPTDTYGGGEVCTYTRDLLFFEQEAV